MSYKLGESHIASELEDNYSKKKLKLNENSYYQGWREQRNVTSNRQRARL